MQQSVGAREEFDESAKLRQANHLAKISLADLRRRSHLAHHGEGSIAARSARREDMHRAVFEHVDLHASLLDNRLDLLPARTDQIADLVRRNAQLVEARSVRGN